MNASDLLARIAVEPGKMGGKPVIRGRRVTPSMVLNMLANGATRAEVLDAYPALEPEDIDACLLYAPRLSERAAEEGRTIAADAVTKAGCTHQVVVTGSGPAAAQSTSFRWVNTALGNIKAAITGTYRSINSKHVPRYLAAFQYRYNRRYDLAAMIPRLAWAATRTPPMPYRLLKLAEAHA